MLTASNEVVIVLPKYSAFEFKDISQQIFYKAKLMSWIEFFRAKNFKVVCFAEDMLAVKLLSADNDVKWISLVGAADSRFIEKQVTDYPEEYLIIPKVEADRELIRQAVQKHKAKDLKFFDYNADAFHTHRLSVIHARLRTTANAYINEAKAVVFFEANNNFCNRPAEDLGNGNLCVVVDVLSESEYFTFGGYELSKENFEQVMEGIWG